MTNAPKRANAYWMGRLEKEGRGDLLDRIDGGEITVYKAAQLAGYRRSGPSTVAKKLSYHWERANHTERKLFIVSHLADVNRVLREVGGELRKKKEEQKAIEERGK